MKETVDGLKDVEATFSIVCKNNELSINIDGSEKEICLMLSAATIHNESVKDIFDKVSIINKVFADVMDIFK